MEIIIESKSIEKLAYPINIIRLTKVTRNEIKSDAYDALGLMVNKPPEIEISIIKLSLILTTNQIVRVHIQHRSKCENQK